MIRRLFLSGVAAMLAAPIAWADAVTDWNVIACDIVAAANMPTPPANRLLALMHTASYEAANAITGKYPVSGARAGAPPGASVDAAIAAANRAVLVQLVPAQQPALERAYQTALGRIAAGAARDAGVAVGERHAQAVLARRADDGALAAESYRPATSAGVYVPTTLPAVTQWPGRKPWLMESAAQFRPGPPPALTSERWARDYNEIKALGGRNSTVRSAAQTDMARFWEATLPSIYYGLVRNVAADPGRDITRNARLFAAVTEAIDDAMIAVFDAKYHYNFWRPVTAIRNGDIDGNDATERAASWLPLIETPLHPEYPCAHCIVAATVATILKADIGRGPAPQLSTESYMMKGVTRSWSNLDDFSREVNEARICDGVHFRYSTEVGAEMGRKVGALAVARFVLNE